MRAQGEINPAEATRRPGLRSPGNPARAGTRRQWIREPKSAVWMALALIVLVGGGRRMLRAWRARKAVARLSDPDVRPEDLEAVAEFGREGAWELLRLFSTSESEPIRRAAGRVLARLWRGDELVAEEEQAIIRRGYSVDWRARRRYPRALTEPIPIAVAYDVPILPDEAGHVRGADLEWSHRITGARRAALEEFSTWRAGADEVAFSIIPGDFPTNGPHRLVLESRVRTVGLTGGWEIDLPHVPFTFDFDPVLRLDAILSLPDAARDDVIRHALRLEAARAGDGEPARLVPVGGEWVLRHPPRLTVGIPLPSDLAHRVTLEFEGHPGRFPAGTLVLSGQGPPQRGSPAPAPHVRLFDVGPIGPLPEGVIDRPGPRRVRAHLVADPQLGWANPEIRSVWAGVAVTDWAEVEVVRR